MNESYIVNDLENYAQSIRKNAALSFSETYDEDLDNFITIPQVCKLIADNAIGVDEENNYIIDEDSYNDTFDQVRTWLYNVGLARLAGAGHIECAWDNDANEMIFWVNESTSKHKASNNDGVASDSKPKRKSNKSPKRKNT